MLSNMVRTRFAPSPTGYMHIGNLRSALYAYLLAKSQNGQFLLRIEDTDQSRYVKDSLEIIYKTLKMAKLNHDEGPDVGGNYGPYVQSERKEIYKQYADELVIKSKAYYCFCMKKDDEVGENDEEIIVPTYPSHCLCRDLTLEEALNMKKQGQSCVVRQKMPQEGFTTFHDLVYGDITVENKVLDDQVLLKSDGLPTYNFANVVDDHLMKITHIVRGCEYLSSTPKYNLLYDAFGWAIPYYIHVPLITNEHGKKLSKRNGDASFQDLVSKGFLSDAIINYILLLGWSSGDDRELFSLEEMKQFFHIKGISKSPSIMDVKKLRWMNGMYIRKLSIEQFHELALPYYNKVIFKSEYNLLALSIPLQLRIDVFSDIPSIIDYVEETGEYSTELFIHKGSKSTKEISLEALLYTEKIIELSESWSPLVVEDSLKEWAKGRGYKSGQALWPLRTVLTGRQVSCGGSLDFLNILGRNEVLKRIKYGIFLLQK